MVDERLLSPLGMKQEIENHSAGGRALLTRAPTLGRPEDEKVQRLDEELAGGSFTQNKQKKNLPPAFFITLINFFIVKVTDGWTQENYF